MFFNRGCYYGCYDDPMRFAFFSKAAMEFLLLSNKRPDVIHCHDWQTGLIPVMLFEIYKYNGMEFQRTLYTIHNFKHQGIGANEILRATGLNRDDYYFQYDRLRDNFNPFAINFMKGGITYANHVNTVSPYHAWEAQHTDQGFGLGHSLHLHQHKFSGILNGIDYDVWNPEVDRYIPHHYGLTTFEDKALNKKELRERLLLQQSEKPLVAFIGRLDDQKGVHLVHHAIYYTLARGGQFVLLGSATEKGINDWFWHEKLHLNENPDVHLEIGFNEELAHLIYAGADMIVVPSNFEPCGLTQMIGLRYGTVPIVRGVGGLVNTVFDWDYDSFHEVEDRNGFVFFQSDNTALESAMNRAFDIWEKQPRIFEQIARQGMQYDFSWNNPGQAYVDIYDYIRHK
jgi:starch synthase